MDAELRSKMEERGKIPPTLPRSNPTQSCWQDPESDIASLRSTDQLPEIADYVVVGSGISGASIAWNLLRKNSAVTVAVLEARAACSGATGRNGGHTKAASYRAYMDHAARHGTADAIRICRLEKSNIDATHSLCAIKPLVQNCESRPCPTVDIIYDAATFEVGKRAVAQMKRNMGASDPAAQYEVFDAASARKEFLVDGDDVVGAIKYPAGSISAYKFGIGILKMGLEKGLNLQTYTPVTGVEPLDEKGREVNGESEYSYQLNQPTRWMVHTDRGSIRTPNLIVAANGYSAHLLPELLGNVVPYRGQIIAQTPGSTLRSLKPRGLPTTYSFIYGNGYEYMIQRPQLDAVPEDCKGDIVIGGGIGKLPDDGVEEFGNTDDSTMNSKNSPYLRKTNETFFGSNWGPPEEAPVKKEWSGIMGATKDGAPFVGELPGAEGLWVSAGFNGQGMVLCFKCAEALVEMMFGAKVETGQKLDWFPRSFLVTKMRLDKGTFQGRKGFRAVEDNANV